MAEPHLIDPRTLYKANEYPKQEQDTPALEEKMIPKPDCGETSYKGSGKLLNRRVLITGGDSGIGRAAAIAYAREGADVAIQFFPGEEPDAEEVAELIKKAGRKIKLLPYDLREDEAATAIVSETVEAFGGLDTLVLNAAQQISRPTLSERPMKQVEDTFKVNIISMFATVQAAEAHLPVGGAIVLSTSIQANDPSEDLMDYAATKAAIANYTVSLSKYFAPKGIRVNAVAPGPIWTPLQLDGGQTQEVIQKFGLDTPLKRAGQPAELAPVYVFLASNDASYVTSQIYGVTGGGNINL